MSTDELALVPATSPQNSPTLQGQLTYPTAPVIPRKRLQALHADDAENPAMDLIQLGIPELQQFFDWPAEAKLNFGRQLNDYLKRFSADRSEAELHSYAQFYRQWKSVEGMLEKGRRKSPPTLRSRLTSFSKWALKQRPKRNVTIKPRRNN